MVTDVAFVVASIRNSSGSRVEVLGWAYIVVDAEVVAPVATTMAIVLLRRWRVAMAVVRGIETPCSNCDAAEDNGGNDDMVVLCWAFDSRRVDAVVQQR